jgi:Lon protease-like protein
MEIQNIPLFPLKIVLFPYMLLPLHIFEERYKQMIGECWGGDRLFGVVLIKEGREVGGPASPYEVGTTAHIEDLVRLDDGRMNLVALGQERFRVVRITQREPFLRADVRAVRDAATASASLPETVERTSELAREYIQLLLRQVGQRPQQMDLPTDPEHLSYILASSLQIDLLERQVLLELTNTQARLEQLEELLQRETAQLREALAEQQAMDEVKGGNGKLKHRLLPRS